MNYSIQNMTWLPVKEVVNVNSSASAVIVTTPMGLKNLDYSYVSHGLFTAARSVEKPNSQILSELRKLEDDSMEFLINRWKESLTKETR